MGFLTLYLTVPYGTCSSVAEDTHNVSADHFSSLLTEQASFSRNSYSRWRYSCLDACCC
jgi:hypothetical protein